MDKRLAAYVTELIGTYFLVLSIGLSTELGVFAPITIGCVLAAMIYAGGHLSKAHYNPAITLAFWLRGHCERRDVLPYIGAQLVGAVLAAGTVGVLVETRAFIVPSFELGPLVVAELVFTFALAWVILNVATAAGTAGNPYYGVAIGAVVVGGIYAVGPISGAGFNPAVSFALCLLGLAEWGRLGVYVLSQVAGAVLATYAFKIVVRD